MNENAPIAFRQLLFSVYPIDKFFIIACFNCWVIAYFVAIGGVDLRFPELGLSDSMVFIDFRWRAVEKGCV